MFFIIPSFYQSWVYNQMSFYVRYFVIKSGTICNTRFSFYKQHVFLGENVLLMWTEVVFQRYSVKKEFLKISQNSQENSCARVFFK